jgi:D-cysteine desulfhydrase family pyridoxal phosphate-dependent enzyme
MRLAELPRIHVGQLPTPLEEAKRLSNVLGGPRIYFKRDDLTGIGLGGNKVRKLEFIIGKALEEGADTLVVCGGFQSNMARVSAAIANRVGLKAELVLGGLPGEPRPPVGNLLLDHLLGANIRYVDTVPRWEFGVFLEEVAEELRGQGRRPFILAPGGSSPEGMAGYLSASLEMAEQFSAQGIAPSRVFVAVGSGSTYGGLVLGSMNIDPSFEVVGISVSRTSDYLGDKIPELAANAIGLLGLDKAPARGDLTTYDNYIGDGYGALTKSGAEAIRLVAETEGVFLDPVYTGKCMAGVIDLIRKGVIGKDETIVFVHTGGSPALFAYDKESLMA